MKNVRSILGFCGACIAFYIGAGFATMQEVMQYEASYGSLFWVVIIVAAAIYVYTNYSFTLNGNRFHLQRGGDIYQVYCGKWIGLFFDFFSALFCYMSFVVMCGGANSTCIEQWGMPNGLGAIILTSATIITVVFGLNGVVKALKVVGPIIIFLIVLISCWTAITGLDKFSEGLAAIDNHKYEITQVGDGNPFASGASYGGFVILWFAAFLAELGAKNPVKNVNRGMLLSTIAIFGVAAVCCIALIGHIDETWNVGVPALMLAGSIYPLFSTAYAFIIFLGIYSSATPLLWTAIGRIAINGTIKYKVWAVCLGVLGCIIACYVPYRPLLNIIYGLNGYLGFILIVFMIWNDIKIRYSINHTKN